MAGTGTFTISGTATAQQISLPSELLPAGGPRAIGFNLDFIDYAANVIDFTYAYENTQFQSVMGVFIDNSQNAYPLEIAANQAPFQNIICPPQSQGTFLIFAPIRPKFTVTTQGSLNLTLVFTNVPIPEFVWSAEQAGTLQLSGPTNSQVATGGSAVNPFGTRRAAGGSYVTNPLAATESLFVDPVNTAGTTDPGTHGTTTQLLAGQTFVVPPGTLATLSVNAVTNGHTFTAVGVNLT